MRIKYEPNISRSIASIASGVIDFVPMKKEEIILKAEEYESVLVPFAE